MICCETEHKTMITLGQIEEKNVFFKIKVCSEKKKFYPKIILLVYYFFFQKKTFFDFFK